MITRLKLDHFTAFSNLDIHLSKGINIFIGENGTGKTHILKTLYSACCTIDSREQKTFAQKINDVFYPSNKQIGRLVMRSVGRGTAELEVYKETKNHQKSSIKLSITTLGNKTETSQSKWQENERFSATYIPVKDMMANAPGFVALYANKEIHFEEIYVDIINKAYLPTIKGPTSKDRKKLLEILQKAMSGTVVEKNGEFYLKNKSGNLEFTLLAEGYRKLGLLWTLIQNGTLTEGSVLFWDEPETNLNPKLTSTVVEVLLELQRQGVQIFLATHDYMLLKEFDLRHRNTDVIQFFSLFQSEGNILFNTTPDFNVISPNAIEEAFTGLIENEIKREMGSLGK